MNKVLKTILILSLAAGIFFMAGYANLATAGKNKVASTDIIKGITKQLSGNNEKDVKFLYQQTEKYKGQEYSQEILKEIEWVIYARLSGEQKNKFDEDVVAEKSTAANILNKAKIKIGEGKLEEAEKLLKSILPDKNKFKEDKVSIYFAFDEPMEEIYYTFKFTPKKEVRINPDVNTEVFLTYAYLLFEKKEYAKALKILKKGLKHNPVDTNLLFEKGEIYKIKKDWTTFREITDLCLEYSYKSEDLARVYRNYGYMFIEQRDYDGAICCYLLSNQYFEHAMAKSQLFYIAQVSRKVIDTDYYYENLEKMLGKRKIQIGPSKDILGLAYALGSRYEKEKDDAAAYYFYSILFDLTKNDEIKAKLEKLKTRKTE